MAEWFSADGKLDPAAFTGWPQLSAFLKEETEFWSGLGAEALSHGAAAVVARQKAVLNALGQQAARHRVQNQSISQGVRLLVEAFDGPSGEMIGSGSAHRARMTEIEQLASLSAGLFHVGLKRGAVGLADARDREDMIGGFWEVAPALMDTAALGERLRLERENARAMVRQLSAETAAGAAAADTEWRRLTSDAGRTARRWAASRNWRWRRDTRAWRDRLARAEADIRAVEATYKEHMGLAAPVDYWKNKAAQHRKTEIWMRLWVLAYFPLALAGMAYAFNETAVSLIDAARAAQAPGAAPFPNAIFIVASAGLASCAGIVFWVGRLLTKLYLSQHHLRQDAEERATMTETYLALIENSAASAEDRQVILNALFRNTPDGIVKEDGGLDPSIAAALGKFLAKP